MEHQFKADIPGLIDLLSNHIYSSPTVYIREMLQNAVDAITARQSQDNSFAPAIDFTFVSAGEDSPPAIIAEDNGIGLTASELHEFLSTIGRSSKRNDIDTMREDFLGQFGIGILACFLVTDEIKLVTRSIRKGEPALEWTASIDGTYVLRELDADLEPGTRVHLRPRDDGLEDFGGEQIGMMLRQYGELLPYPVMFTNNGREERLTRDTHPWNGGTTGRSPDVDELMAYGGETFGKDFLDAFPIHLPELGIEGAAFVLNQAASVVSRPANRIYLRGMLVTDSDDTLLPPWAVFCHCVLNTKHLRPSASRESFHDDEHLHDVKRALGESLKTFLIETSRREPQKFHRFMNAHLVAVKLLAVEDDECFKLFMDFIPFQTFTGWKTFQQIRKITTDIRYVPFGNQFRQVAAVADEYELLLNAGHFCDADLLEKSVDFYPDVRVTPVDPVQVMDAIKLKSREESAYQDFVERAEACLTPFKCAVEAMDIESSKVPAVITASEDMEYLRALEFSHKQAQDEWQGVLEDLEQETAAECYFVLYFNTRSPLVQRIASVRKDVLFSAIVRLLYVQALMLGSYPLMDSELDAVNTELLDLIDFATLGK